MFTLSEINLPIFLESLLAGLMKPCREMVWQEKYRDDGLAIIKNRSERLADKTRKELYKVFEQYGIKITAKSNLHVVNSLDVTFDLTTGKYKPNGKPNDHPLYIQKH